MQFSPEKRLYLEKEKWIYLSTHRIAQRILL